MWRRLILTRYLKHRPCSCQQAEKTSHKLTYILFKIKSILLSATSRKGQLMLTYILFKTKSMLLSATSREDNMLTYILFKTKSMPLSATSRNGQSDAAVHPIQNPEHAPFSNKQEGPADTDLHAVQNPEHAPVSNKQEGQAICLLTYCSKLSTCCSQQQAGMASQMLTYKLFKTQSMLLSATRRECPPDADLQPDQNPEHALLSNK